MSAAFRVEMRALLRSWPARLVIVLAILAPALAYGLQWILMALSPDDGYYAGEFGTYIGYVEALQLSLVAGGAAAMLCAAMIGTSSHRHKVYQAYAVTGHPKDLLLAGRLVLAASVAFVVMAGSLAVGFTVSWATFPDGPTQCDRDPGWCGQDGYVEPVDDGINEFAACLDRECAVPPITPIPVPGDGWCAGFDECADDLAVIDAYSASDGGAVRDQPLARVVAEVALALTLVVLAAVFVAALATVTRSIIATGVLMVAWLVLEDIAMHAHISAWERAARVVPLDALASVPARYHRPWWSVTTAVEHMVTGIPSRLAWGGVLLLTGFCILAAAAALWRMARRDA